MQKNAHLVDLEKRCKMSIWLQKSASIQPRTSPIKFDHLLKLKLACLSTALANISVIDTSIEYQYAFKQIARHFVCLNTPGDAVDAWGQNADPAKSSKAPKPQMQFPNFHRGKLEAGNRIWAPDTPSGHKTPTSESS